MNTYNNLEQRLPELSALEKELLEELIQERIEEVANGKN